MEDSYCGGAHTLQHWCRMQERVALSSGEAELRAACRGVAEMLSLKVLADFLMPRSVSIELRLDANATIGMIHRQGAGKIKHLDIRTLWIQECVLKDNIKVTKIPRSMNLADALCSIHSQAEFVQKMVQIGMVLTDVDALALQNIGLMATSQRRRWNLLRW